MGDWINESLGKGGAKLLDGMFSIASLNNLESQKSQKDTSKGGDPAPEAGTGGKGGGNTVDENRLDNARNKSSENNVTGKLRLRNYPELKAKEGVTILNVGSAASGLWYVKDVTHTWDVKSGLLTTADLLRTDAKTKEGKGKGPKSGKTGEPPIMHADIRKDAKSIICKKRNLNAASQMTFTYGDGQYIEAFSWQVGTSKKSGSDRKKETKSGNMDSIKKATQEVSKDLPGGGGSK